MKAGTMLRRRGPKNPSERVENIYPKKKKNAQVLYVDTSGCRAVFVHKYTMYMHSSRLLQAGMVYLSCKMDDTEIFGQLEALM